MLNGISQLTHRVRQVNKPDQHVASAYICCQLQVMVLTRAREGHTEALTGPNQVGTMLLTYSILQ